MSPPRADTTSIACEIARTLRALMLRVRMFVRLQTQNGRFVPPDRRMARGMARLKRGCESERSLVRIPSSRIVCPDAETYRVGSSFRDNESTTEFEFSLQPRNCA